VSLLLVSEASGQKTKKRKVKKKEAPAAVPAPEPETSSSSPADSIYTLLERDEEAEERQRIELEAKLRDLEASEGQELNELEDFVESYAPDPCADKRCGPGRECIPLEEGKGPGARCSCMKKCPSEEDFRRRVCSNYNETWVSDCELYRSRCLCDDGDPQCSNTLNKHLHIDYYGECREMPGCSEAEMADFPRRMRDWLFNVMREMADRRELSPHYLQMEREAETAPGEGTRTGIAAIWKWCDLDGHPHDKSVSRHELFPIRAPLMALEHCIGPFLDSCDVDNDHRITLKEWGTCLGIPSNELQDRCDDVRNTQENLAGVNDEEI